MKRSTLMKALIALPMVGLLATATPALAGKCKSCNSCDSKKSDRTVQVAADMDIVDTAVAAGQFKTLAAALGAADLVDALKGDGPFTVFAPTDEAFAALPEGTVETLLKPENKALLTAILTYHVVPGNLKAEDVVGGAPLVSLNGQKIDLNTTDGVMVDKANVVKTDIETSNGTIHVIDAVILPSTKDIIDTAIEAGSFKTLAAALGAAELVETLQGDGPFTVFAPTDDAFAALPAGTVESLLKPENKAKLQAVLTYHVVPGRIYAHDAIKAGKAKTVQGQEVTIKAMDGKVTVDGANVIAADIDSSNGVVHVIDAVILPKD
ncbi:MAG: fasciclin domain-containing protein [Planctomycetota bacterium]